MPTDIDFMRQALELAAAAGQAGEVPVGAVAVHQGRVVGRGANRRETDKSALAHAELLALAEASRALDAWRLNDLTLYVTLEPCAMCAGAMVQGRVRRVVYGAADPKAGAAGSLYNLLADPRHNHQVEVSGGVLADACGSLLTEFFRGLRQRTC